LSNNAVLSESGTYGVGHILNSKALLFNGSQTASITFTDNYNYENMTFSSIIKMPVLGACSIVQKVGMFDLYVDGTGIVFLKTIDSGATETIHTSTIQLDADTYTTVAVVLDKFNQTIQFYKYGALTDTVSSFVPNFSIDNTNDIVIGSGMNGSISQIKMSVGYKAYETLTLDLSENKILANYTFDESSGSIAIDKSSYANSGTLVNDPTRKFGTYDNQSKGLAFDASLNQSVSIPGTHYDTIDFNNVTMSAWVYASNDNLNKSIITKTNCFDFGLTGSGNIVFTDNVSNTYTTTGAITDNTWTHIGLTINEFDQNITFYTNGTQLEQIAQSPSINIPMTTSGLIIGNQFTGELDNVMIHKGVLDFSVHTELYAVPDNNYTPPSIGADTWSHVAAVYNKEMNMVTMYKDGEYSGCYENYLNDFNSIGTNSNNMYIGTTGNNQTFFDGSMDDIRIYKNALSKTEIKNLYDIYGKNVVSYIDKTSIVDTTFRYDGLNSAASIEVGPVSISGDLTVQTLSTGYTTSSITHTYYENNTEVRWTPSNWSSFTLNGPMVNTTNVGSIYEFELTEITSSTSGYLVFGFDSTATPGGSSWNGGGGSTESQRILLRWHSTLSRADDYDSTFTLFENGASPNCRYWRLTIVNHADFAGTGTLNDILYEGFTDAERTVRVLSGYGSRMYFGETNYANGETFFKNNSEFYITLGGHPATTFSFKNFKAGSSLQYYAFATNTNRFSGIEDINYFISNIDSIPTTYYKTTITSGSSWDIGTLDKVMDSSLIAEADASLLSYVYLYIIAKSEEGNIDYFKSKVIRTYDPVYLSIDAYIDNTSTPVIKISDGSAISVYQYFILAFNGQPALEDVQTFVQTHIYNASTYNAGGAMYIVNGHSVYSYKVSGTIPTASDHVINTSFSLTNAFLGTASANTTPVPVDISSAFTTYIIGVDGNGNVITQFEFFFKINNKIYSESASGPYKITVDETIDYNENKTPWVLVMNYLRKNGTTPSLNARTLEDGLPVLPQDGTYDENKVGTLGVDGSSVLESWGHTNAPFFNKVCESLGSLDTTPYNSNGLELRVLGKCSAHSRVVHFKTNNENIMRDFRKADVGLIQSTGVFTDVTTYSSTYVGEGLDTMSDHTGILPEGSDRICSGSSEDTVMTAYPFYKDNGSYHWNIDIFEMDQNGQSGDALFQYWVRADNNGDTFYKPSFTFEPSNTYVATTFKVSFEMDDPTVSGLTVKSGSIVVGTSGTPITKYSMFTFETAQYNNGVLAFYNDYVSSITTSTSTIHVDTGIKYAGQTVDLTTVSFTQAFSSEMNGNTVAVTENNEYFTYVVTENALGEFNVIGQLAGEWELLHRDIAGKYFTIIQNKNIDAIDDFTDNYSLLGDMQNGLYDNDAYKSDGKYLFRWIPYSTVANPQTMDRLSPDNETRYIEWTQTSNPTIISTTVSGFGDLKSLDKGVESTELISGSANYFNGLYHRGASWRGLITGSAGDPDCYALAKRASWRNNEILFNIASTDYAGVQKTELYIWNNKTVALTNTTPFSVSFEMNDPTNTGLTVKSGNVIVGSENNVSKFLIFTFTTEQSTTDVETFYTNNLTTTTTTTTSVYANTTYRYIGQTVDLATLGVSLTDAYTGVGTATEAIVDTNEYFTYLVSVNDIGGVNVVGDWMYITSYIDSNTDTQTIFPIVKSFSNSNRNTTFQNIFSREVGSRIKVLFDPDSPVLISTSYGDTKWRSTMLMKGVYFGMLHMNLDVADVVTYKMSTFFVDNVVQFNQNLPWTSITANTATGNIAQIGRLKFIQFVLEVNDVRVQLWNTNDIMIAEWLASTSSTTGTYDQANNDLSITSVDHAGVPTTLQLIIDKVLVS
jgi:hypothetical protein